jgi:hypothetical protein
MRARDRAGNVLGEPPGVLERAAPVDRHEDVETLAP